MPFQDVRLPGGRIPDSGRLVPTSGDDPLTVGEKRDGPDRSRVLTQGKQLGGARSIPYLFSPIRAGGDNLAAIRRVRDGSNATTMAPQDADSLSTRTIPHT